MNEIVVDASDAILGRLASKIAKMLLEGKRVIVINAERAIVTGNRDEIFARYKQKYDRGHKYKGPFFPRRPDLLVKRTIRGMLPWKKYRGREAYKRLRVYIGVPENIKPEKAIKIEEASIVRSNAPRFVRVEEISRFLGWRP